jgi:hypothetical protein
LPTRGFLEQGFLGLIYAPLPKDPPELQPEAVAEGQTKFVRGGVVGELAVWPQGPRAGRVRRPS